MPQGALRVPCFASSHPQQQTHSLSAANVSVRVAAHAAVILTAVSGHPLLLCDMIVQARPATRCAFATIANSRSTAAPAQWPALCICYSLGIGRGKEAAATIRPAQLEVIQLLDPMQRTGAGRPASVLLPSPVQPPPSPPPRVRVRPNQSDHNAG